MDGKDAAIMLVLLAAFATAGWVIYLAADTAKRQRRLKAQVELHTRLLDKFSSANEVVEFLQTPTGAQFVDGISSDRAPDRRVASRTAVLRLAADDVRTQQGRPRG